MHLEPAMERRPYEGDGRQHQEAEEDGHRHQQGRLIAKIIIMRRELANGRYSGSSFVP